SHVLKWVMVRFESATLGVLMGLLVGAVVGLWPFQRGVPPQVGDIIKAQQVTADTLAAIDPADWRVEFFQPTVAQALAAVALIMLGFILTLVVARLGREKPERGVTTQYTENTERGVS